jgi:hypothetical protein
LPLSFAKYSLSGGKNLYLDEYPIGKTEVIRQEHFTGDIAVASYFLTEDPDGDNWMVGLRVTFLKGEVVDVQIERTQKQARKEYDTQMTRIKDGVNEKLATINSWWFKWLYRPYALIVGFIGGLLIFFLKILAILIRKIVFWMTPL